MRGEDASDDVVFGKTHSLRREISREPGSLLRVLKYRAKSLQEASDDVLIFSSESNIEDWLTSGLVEEVEGSSSPKPESGGSEPTEK